MSDSRERFIQWCRENDYPVGIRSDDSFVGSTEVRWQAWQAAEAQAVRRCVEWIDAWSVHGDRVDNMKNSIKQEFPEAFHE
jgi:hypothetical protein